MIEEHAPLPPYLTLEEAAEAVSSRLGQKWTARNILGCAARGEISIFARIPSACRLVRVEPLDGEEFTVPAGHLPRISAKAANALLAAGVATFDERTELRTTEFFGEKVTEMATVWKIAEGDTAPEITPDNCRVGLPSLEQIADRYATKLEAAPHGTPAAKVEPAPVTSASDDNWIQKARTIADRIGPEKYRAGMRQITARNICDAVASELALDETTWGQQGARGADNVRNVGLRGWEFTPPKEAQKVD